MQHDPTVQIPSSSLGEGSIEYAPNWERISWSAGYPVIFCPDHPNAWATGYVLLHRVVMEMVLGRLLSEDEVVHHKNHDKTDFRPDNLEVLSSPDHARLHKKPLTLLAGNCKECGAEIIRRKGKSLIFCGYSCNGKYQRRTHPSPKGISTSDWHGTSQGYGYHRCRCAVCKEGTRLRQAARRLKLRSRSEVDIAQPSEG